MKLMTALALALFGALSIASCSRDVQALDAQQIEQQYGVAGGHAGTVDTPDGPVTGMLVPITLANGRTGQLFIPQAQAHMAHSVYLRDERGLHPVQLGDNVRRDELTRSPGIVETRTVAPRSNQRSWEKQALIIGGSAGAGAGIGAIAGGKKGAGIGAAAGGVGGLIFDLLTKDKKR